MTQSFTSSSTFTISDARYVAAKMGADLRGLYARYNRPEADKIEDFVEETAQCLKHGYLKTVDFGFKRGDEWILRLRYTATAGGQLTDGPTGRLPAAAQLSDCHFYSHLSWSDSFYNLSTAEQQVFRAALPINRTSADAPSLGAGHHGNATAYSRHGAGLSRDVFSRY